MNTPPLRDRLALTQLDENLFESGNNAMRNGHVFGGTTLACSVAAAQATVPDDLNIHSLHAYYLRAGKDDQPIHYEVEPSRDGRSFSTRRVVAKQGDDIIFITSMSFQIVEEGLTHQIDMSEVPQPEKLLNTEDLAKAMPKEKMWEHRNDPAFLPFDRRHIISAKSPFKGHWLRFKEGPVESKRINTQLLAYISDYALLMAALGPHGFFEKRRKLQNIASIDHAMWFHEPNIKVDEWLYYETVSPWSGNARGLSNGAFYTRDGKLVATAMQEGLIRMKPEELED